MDTKIYFEKWSEKLSIPMEEIQSEYDNLLKKEKTNHPDNNVEVQEKRALQRLALLYKKQLRSPAIGFEGMVIGVGDVFDTVKKIRTTGMDAFRENPQSAIELGITDKDGNPLDTRQTFSTGRENRSFGKQLPEHSYIRNIVGVALRSNVKEAPKMFTMTLNGEKAEHCDIDMFNPVKFRAINKSEENSDMFVLNGSTVTKFDVSDKIEMPNAMDVLKKFCNNMFVPINKLDEYHNANKEDFNRLALIEGDVSMLSNEPTSVGNKMMIIEDMEESMNDIEARGITCWVPKNIEFNFGEGSKVIVVGKTSQGKSRENPNELGDVMVNVLGIYAIPEFKVEPLTDENIDKAIEKAQEKIDEKSEVPIEKQDTTNPELKPEQSVENLKEETQTDLNSW